MGEDLSAQTVAEMYQGVGPVLGGNTTPLPPPPADQVEEENEEMAKAIAEAEAVAEHLDPILPPAAARPADGPVDHLVVDEPVDVPVNEEPVDVPPPLPDAGTIDQLAQAAQVEESAEEEQAAEAQQQQQQQQQPPPPIAACATVGQSAKMCGTGGIGSSSPIDDLPDVCCEGLSCMETQGRNICVRMVVAPEQQQETEKEEEEEKEEKPQEAVKEEEKPPQEAKVTALPAPSPTLNPASCELWPDCAKRAVSGLCCPTATGAFLNCCAGYAPPAGYVSPSDHPGRPEVKPEVGQPKAAAAAATVATPKDVKQAARPQGGGGNNLPEVVPPVPEQYGGQAGLVPPTFPPKAQAEEEAEEEVEQPPPAHHPQDIIVDKEPIETTLAQQAHAEAKGSATSNVNVVQQPPPPPVPVDPRAKSIPGGLLNAYQSAPLSQGIGTHYATVWVGSPTPQRQSVIVDTGSHYTAFPCRPECYKCGEKYHTDSLFDPNLSATFHALTCSECEPGASCSGGGVNGQCQFSQSYTEGSSWHAYQARDRFYCGTNGPTVPSDDGYAIDFTFGCQTSETGLFITQLADGIMGMAANDATLTKRMRDAGKIERLMFAMCFRKELTTSKDGIEAGVLTLGGYDSGLDSSPMLYAAEVSGVKGSTMGRSGWFTVRVRNLYLRSGGGQSAMADDSAEQHVTRVKMDPNQVNSGKGVIVDSGTTDTYFHRSLARPFADAFQRLTGRTYNNRPMKLTREQLLSLPTLLVQLEAYDDTVDPSMGPPDTVPGLAGSALDPTRPADVVLAVPATHYMEYDPDKDNYTPRLYFSEGQGGVLGANAMMGHDILFDWENGRVGFAESECRYRETAISGGEEGPGGAAEEVIAASVEADCELGIPSLEEECLKTVDLTACDGGEASAALTLRGTEKWTMVVEAPGTPGGRSCEEVILTDRPPPKGEVPEVYCDGNGLCFDSRPCEMTCADAEALGAIDVVPIAEEVAEEETQGSDQDASSFDDFDPAFDDFDPCGDNLWGACEYACNQTKISSILMSDGFCHEDESMRVTRPCHIDACGRSDPCRVPFVVHAVMAFRGANAPLWSKRSEDKFASAFADAVNNKKSEGDELFGPGDVKVLMASPWYENDGNNGTPMGMKVVAEISIYNPRARLPEGYVYEPITEEKASSLAANSTSDGGAKETIKSMVTKVKGVWQEWTKPMAICDEADIYNLAHNALDVHMELERPNFMAELIQALRQEEGSKLHFSSPFTPIFEQRSYAEESEFLSSWTIKSEIGGGTLHEHPIPTIRGFNKETVVYYVTNIPFMTVVLSLLFCVCCCGMCFGLKCARGRQDRLQIETLMNALKERNADKARGRYEKINFNGTSPRHEDDDDEHEISFGGNGGYRDNPEDDGADDIGDLELAEIEDGDDRMSRLKNEL